MSHQPYIPADSHVKEFTLRALLLGLAFGFLFAIANAYLALKIGQTVSASIPAAIMSMAILRLFSRNSTVLENNLVQTIATVGEALASGVIFTVPALFLLGDAPSVGRIFLLAATGGILGILFMIPMRRHLIVEEHGKLPFPEGTACAEIIKAGEKSHRTALMATWGFLAGAVYKLCTSALFLWNETVTWAFHGLRKAEFSLDGTPALLGVGYIIGPRISALMFTGSVIAWWVIIPLIVVFGLGDSVVYPGAVPISEMSSDDIWNKYIRYIGAGTLAVGGLLGLVRIFPVLFKAIRVGFTELFSGIEGRAHLPRTQKDISLRWLLIGSLAIILFLWLFPSMPMNLFTIVLLVILSFFFVAVTCFTVGLVGSTTNPLSGMTITVLLITSVIFVLLNWTERAYLISAMTMGCVACCAITMAGTTAQDLKAGFLLGSTPRSQQIAEIIGVFIPSLVIGYTLYIFNDAYGIGSKIIPAPQATLMAMVVEGVIQGSLPYTLVAVGAILGIGMALLRVPVLPFALGVYLPHSLSAAIIVGGIARIFVDRIASKKSAEEASQIHERGTLLASGIIGGDACIGIAIALLTLAGAIPASAQGILPNLLSLALYLLFGAGLAYFSSRIRRAN